MHKRKHAKLSAPSSSAISDDDADDPFAQHDRQREAEQARLASRRARILSRPLRETSPSKPRAPPSPSPPPSIATKRAPKRPFDIFSSAPVPSPTVPALATDAADGPADDGYAQLRTADRLQSAEREYVVRAALGMGVFSSVYSAVVPATGRLFAIKLVRANDLMRRAALREVATLRNILRADPDDAMHCVRMHDHFVHRGHVAIVFESLSMNLRDVVKNFGAGKGIRLSAVRLYAAQLLAALQLLARLRVIHADVKPDNALVSEDRAVVKLCDFGSALDEEQHANEVSPYLVSRFYRAPEVLLGIPFGRAIDMWSLGCVLAELYTGQILFAGRNNNDMLRLFLEARGSIPMRLLRRAAFRDQYYNADGQFVSKEIDPFTSRPIVKEITVAQKPKVDVIKAKIMGATGAEEEKSDALLFVELLDGMLTLDAAKRLTPNEALKAPFFTSRR